MTAHPTVCRFCKKTISPGAQGARTVGALVDTCGACWGKIGALIKADEEIPHTSLTSCSSEPDQQRGKIFFKVTLANESTVELIRIEVHHCYVLDQRVESNSLVYPALREWLTAAKQDVPHRSCHITIGTAPGGKLVLEIEGEDEPRVSAQDEGGKLVVRLLGISRDAREAIWDAFLIWLQDACRRHMNSSSSGVRLGA